MYLTLCLNSCQGPLPLESTLLGEQAMKCRAYAKALHYKEEEFHCNANTQILESLIRSVAPYDTYNTLYTEWVLLGDREGNCVSKICRPFSLASKHCNSIEIY